MLEQVKASAGSGKTFELTSRFLRLLKNANDGVPAACGAIPGEGYGWSEIMAVTFTNKAAAEMKERVISSLKARALGDKSGPAGEWKANEAALWLTRILRHYHQLNIRTIDSLLNMFMRIFALDVGVSPDFTVIFDINELFEELFDELAAQAENGHTEEQQLLLNALQAMLYLEQKKGFDLSASFRQRLLDVLRFRLTHSEQLETDPQKLNDILNDLRFAMQNAARELQTQVQNRLAVKKHFLNFLDKCLAFSGTDKTPDSKLMLNMSFCDCVNKKSQDDVSPADEAVFQNLQQAWTAYKSLRPAIEGARNFAPFVPLADRILQDLERKETESGVLLNSLCPSLATRLLDHDTGVPDAYCRMGTRLMHILIDEFQDTGRDQWQALHPLAAECLAKGGSMFFVGDIKQAIYGWRGGDAALFDEVPEDPELLAMTDPERRSLPNNWRSTERIIRFNNTIFSALESPENASELATAMFPKDTKGAGDAIERFAERIQHLFHGAAQDVPEHKLGSGGFVQLQKIEGDDKDGLFENVREKLHQLLVENLAKRRPFGDVAVLVRTNSEAAEVSRWLIEWGVPVITENSLSLAEHPLIRQLVAIMTFMDYPFDDLAFWEFISGEDIFLRHTGVDIKDLSNWLCTCSHSPLFPRFREAFPELWDRHISPFQLQAGLMSPYDMVQEICRHFRVIERNPKDELFVRRFMEVIHCAQEAGHQSLSAFLDYWRDSGGEEKVPLPDSIDAIRVMTIHQSKGLEFPVCVVPFHHWQFNMHNELAITEIGSMHLLSPLRSKDFGPLYWERLTAILQEQLNLLYVAWTRPVDELYAFLTSTPAFRTRYPMVRGLEKITSALPWDEDFEGTPVLDYGENPQPRTERRSTAHEETAPVPDDESFAGSSYLDELPEDFYCTRDAEPVPDVDENGSLGESYEPDFAPDFNGSYVDQLLESDPADALTQDAARPEAEKKVAPSDTQRAETDSLPKEESKNDEEHTAPVQLFDDASETAARPMAWLPRLKIHRHFAKDVTREDMLSGRNWDERARGTLMHEAMDRLHFTGDMTEDIHRAAASAVAAHVDILPIGDRKREAITAEAEGLLRWAVEVPDFVQWITEGSPECPILDKDGNEHRPDLLVTNDSGTLVVEYKTGGKREEHIDQVRRYLRLTQAMPGLSAPYRGIILYLDKQETVTVSASNPETTNEHA
ncbi:UvrD-helicase domain-containing protein [Desulfobaculum bizertense]|uniref:DNA 3'-5' helicase n=1 Tax=Desulfobaculum bizertense DSM 18034 TaxID=1121442 RepID=A0A1T4WH34_9BACT|nr:UvrD-helicase domain-containing protein [Desulfobaculum bizertense]SKA76479.1 ATP-dependent exoDNAse (exonuclease V) beta subunit (contains helicase and exonuclease domains) [Desulfobaculum bizertense DSM 18034]